MGNVVAFPAPGMAETSREAFESVADDMAALKGAVYTFARNCGDFGIIAEDAEVACGIKHQTIGKIMLELRRAGLLVPLIGEDGAHATRKTVSRRRAFIYRAVAKDAAKPITVRRVSKFEKAAQRARTMLKSGNTRGALAALDAAFGG